MNKTEFILELNEKLHGLPEDEIEKSIDFYDEIISDRIEDGADEEEAVASLGDIDDIVNTIISDIPLPKLIKEKMKPKRKLSTFEIVLLVLGAPIWLSLLLSLFAVVLSVYVVIWTVVVCLWAVFVSFVACALSAVVCGFVFMGFTNVYTGLAIVGAGVVLMGLSIFSFYLCKVLSKGMVLLSKKVLLLIKNCFVKKEVA